MKLCNEHVSCNTDKLLSRHSQAKAAGLQEEADALAALRAELRAREQELSSRIALHAEAAADTRVSHAWV